MNNRVSGAMISLGSVFAFILFIILVSRIMPKSSYKMLPRTIDEDFRTDVIQTRI